MIPSAQQLAAELGALAPRDNAYAMRFVDLVLVAARKANASDVHLQPTPQGLDVRWRLDGVLHRVGVFPRGEATDVVARLKVLAELLTYRIDLPQEGRLRLTPGGAEVRVSTFPTLHGERAVIRLFAPSGRLERLDDLGLPDDVTWELKRLLQETSGAILVVGPAGSGKTTTVYAALREIVHASSGQRSVVTLEDPIESALAEAAQSQVNPAAGFDLATGVRSLLRQDPEVVMIGEMRDPATAEAALQASLTGHLVLTTYHAGSAAEAIGRLLDMGLEPYLLRSGLLGILWQRLARRLCRCSVPIEEEADLLGLSVRSARRPVGCEACGQTGYAGRVVLTEMLTVPGGELGRAILNRSDADELERLSIEAGMVSRWQRALDAIEAGQTSPAEIRRVLGVGK